jgi:hypothetical protein
MRLRVAAIASLARVLACSGYMEVAGLSGASPNGRHHIVVLKRCGRVDERELRRDAARL